MWKEKICLTAIEYKKLRIVSLRKDINWRGESSLYLLEALKDKTDKLQSVNSCKKNGTIMTSMTFLSS